MYRIDTVAKFFIASRKYREGVREGMSYQDKSTVMHWVLAEVFGDDVATDWSASNEVALTVGDLAADFEEGDLGDLADRLGESITLGMNAVAPLGR